MAEMKAKEEKTLEDESKQDEAVDEQAGEDEGNGQDLKTKDEEAPKPTKSRAKKPKLAQNGEPETTTFYL